tara:strand:+ start:194 stop:688 length:495 start_codon:yes stop_codon:yes gene_type:complete
MHMVIRNIVYANSESEALSISHSNFDNLCEGGRPFDYYDTFDNGGTSYWGRKLSPTSKINTEEGRKLIVDGWRNTLRDMRYHLQEIQKITENKSALEIIKSLKHNHLQYHYKSIGDYRGSGVWMYDNDGEGIKSRKHLDNVINKWGANEYRDKDIYIVPADVHY